MVACTSVFLLEVEHWTRIDRQVPYQLGYILAHAIHFSYHLHLFQIKKGKWGRSNLYLCAGVYVGHGCHRRHSMCGEVRVQSAGFTFHYMGPGD